MSRGYKKKEQDGFVLALALLMMLFVGVVVISSSQRTGQETRTAQSSAPTATLQAAAEAGLLTLRQKINAASEGHCKDEAEDSVEEFCGCVEDIDLADLMGDGGYPGNEKSFSTQAGGQEIKWWFEKDSQEKHFITCFEDERNDDPRCNDEDLEEGSNICRVVANVFAGDPATKPGHFMRGTIDIQATEDDDFGKNIDELFDLDENKKFENLTADDLAKFYEGFLDQLDTDIFAPKILAAGSTLSADDLDSDKINVLVLEGGLDIELSEKFKDKQVIIVSNKESTTVSEGGGKGGGKGGDGTDENGIYMDGKQGAGAGGISGWIAAPNTGVYTSTGTPHINMNVNVETCQTGAHSDRCFESAGGSGFNDGFKSSDFKKPDSNEDSGSNDDSTSKVKVDSSEQMDMDFDY